MTQVEEDEVFQPFGGRWKSDELLWSGFAQDESQRLRNRVHREAFSVCQYFFAIGTGGNEAANLPMMVMVRKPGLWLCASPRMCHNPKQSILCCW